VVQQVCFPVSFAVATVLWRLGQIPELCTLTVALYLLRLQLIPYRFTAEGGHPLCPLAIIHLAQLLQALGQRSLGAGLMHAWERLWAACWYASTLVPLGGLQLCIEAELVAITFKLQLMRFLFAPCFLGAEEFGPFCPALVQVLALNVQDMQHLGLAGLAE